MTKTLLTNFAEEEESIIHRPIFNYISYNIGYDSFNKIKFYTSPNIFVTTTYKFYDSNNYMIFKLHIVNIFGDYKNILVDVEFTYSSNTLLYWSQLNNPILKLNWKYLNPEANIFDVDLIKNFIQTNLLKNNYFNLNQNAN